MKTVTVVLNGNEHIVHELRSRQNAAWRAKLEEPFAELARVCQEFQSTSKRTEKIRLVGAFLQSLAEEEGAVRMRGFLKKGRFYRNGAWVPVGRACFFGFEFIHCIDKNG